MGNAKRQSFGRPAAASRNLARALVSDPKVLILDEPTDGIQPLHYQRHRTRIEGNQAGARHLHHWSASIIELHYGCVREGACHRRGRFVYEDVRENLNERKNQGALAV